MGYMRHHCFVVTGTQFGGIERAHAAAVEFGLSPTELTPEVTNGYHSFMVPPDGSKEGWDESKAGDARRRRFAEWLVEQRAIEDCNKALYVDWAEIQYGDDEGETIITACDEWPLPPVKG